MAITPRCSLNGNSGTATAGSVSPALTGWTNAGAGVSGTAPATGDIVFIIIMVAVGTADVVTQTAGTGTWTVDDSGTLNGSAFETWVGSRVFDGTETTAPTFSLTTAKRVAWAAMALAPDAGATISIDVFGTVLVDTTAATAHTANAATAGAGNTDCSLILAGAQASANGSNAMTYSAPASWTLPSGASTSGTGGASSKTNGASICYQTGVSSTVTPGAETIEGGSSPTGTTLASLYHVLVTQTSPDTGLPVPLHARRGPRAPAFVAAAPGTFTR